jgi:hypothetical protein
MEDLDVKISEEALTCNASIKCGCSKAVTADPQGSRRRLEAVTRHCHATISGGCDDWSFHGLPPARDGLRLILETALDAVVIMNADGVVADWNDRAASTLSTR